MEIDRFKGGSTFLLANAMNSGKLISLDLHVKMVLKTTGEDFENELQQALNKAGLAQRVEIIVADSTTYKNSNLSIDFLFIDGNYTCEGVKKDYLRWVDSIKSNGHILFHDAVKARPYTTFHQEVYNFVKELEYDSRLIKQKEL